MCPLLVSSASELTLQGARSGGTSGGGAEGEPKGRRRLRAGDAQVPAQTSRWSVIRGDTGSLLPAQALPGPAPPPPANWCVSLARAPSPFPSQAGTPVRWALRPRYHLQPTGAPCQAPSQPEVCAEHSFSGLQVPLPLNEDNSSKTFHFRPQALVLFPFCSRCTLRAHAGHGSFLAHPL